MSQQPDISAILAALSRKTSIRLGVDQHTKQAEAQTGGTPSQSTQPTSQPTSTPGYPGVPSSSTPSNNVSGMPLPQPTKSGSLDLSGVKPVNSGNVSLADAIAKARSATTDKSSREDGRSSSRAYRRSRSRSRSPPRRESFRDNYNPYRDERRDESRRGANGRERSYSPSAQGQGPFSPSRAYQARDRSPLGRGGDNEGNSEIITVPSHHVGMIIGRSGENLRRVEQETGARVQFMTSHESAGPLRQCRVSGTPRQRAEAKREIFRVSEDNPEGPPSRSGNQQSPKPPQPTGTPTHQPALREGEKSVQIMVPDKTVGLIIGRGGETIRDLQERSGCHVNIVGENKSVNGLRPVNLIGSRDAANKAKELILEIVESDTRLAAPNPQPVAAPPPVRGYDPYAAAPSYDPYSSNSKINDTIYVPSEAVGMIIGKGGETIKDMQNASGCKINVSQPSGPDVQREIGLIGTRTSIESAKKLIWDKVHAVREKQGGSGSRGPEPMSYGDPYSQAPPPYGQPAMPPSHGIPPPMPHEPTDPYAAWGGYQNYYNLWYAAMAGQHGQPAHGHESI